MSKSTYQYFSLIPLTFAIQTVLGSSAYAQQVSDNAEKAEDSSIETISVYGRYTVNEKIDTATGLGLTILETPQSVSVLTAERIQDQNLDSVADVVTNAVGVSARQLDSTRFEFSSRGFDISKYQIDGVPLAWSLAGDSGETITDVALYERIEVVRGATGLLTGAGDPSASINLVRKHASHTDFTGYVNAEVGSWSHRQVSADVASGLNDNGTIRGRIVAKYDQGDSFRDYSSDQTSLIYGVLEADLGANTLLRLGGSYQDNNPDASTWGGLPYFDANGKKLVWERNKNPAAKWTSWATESENYFANLVHHFGNDWQLKVNFNQTKNSAHAKLLYLYGLVDSETGEGLYSWPYHSIGESQQDSYDFQLNGTFDAFSRTHDFVVGALYSEQEAVTDTFAALTFDTVGDFFAWDGSYTEPTWSEDPYTAVDMETTQEGYYMATRLNLTDSLNVIAGARLSSWERSGLNYGSELDFGDDNELIPYAGVIYQLNDSHSLYASYAEIFQPQNYQDRNGDYLDPVVGINQEVGLKSSFMDGAFYTAVSVFVIDQDNTAVVDTGYLVPGTIFEAYRGEDGTQSKGFEVEIVGELLENWDITAGYTQFKAEDASGSNIYTSHPRRQFNLFTTYRFEDLVPGLTIGGGVNWQSENYTDTTNPVTGASARLQQDAYALVNLMARYDINDQTSVQLNVANALDETYYSQIGFYSQYGYGEPRNISLGLTYRF